MMPRFPICSLTANKYLERGRFSNVTMNYIVENKSQKGSMSLPKPKGKSCHCLLNLPKVHDSNSNSASSLLSRRLGSQSSCPPLILSLSHSTMALVQKLVSFSSLSSSHSRGRPNSSSSQRTCSLSCNLSTSPFTEKHSIKRYERDQWVYEHSLDKTSSCPAPSDSKSIREDDIALQLPELKKMLQVLRDKRENDGKCSGGKCAPGNVFLVGTGPGDPELLTLKGVRVIKSADLLLYDRLVSNDVLDLVGPDARLLYVGKTAGYHSRTQEEIHELLLSFAEAGATVVRLKGGDPLVFGRGGEEMDFLQQQGIQVKVVPGITAASGIAAELGIPLTHRGVSISVRFLTGHSRKGGTDPLFIAENAADPDSTLVVYMGLSTFPSLALKLMDHGLSPHTPAAAIERGTTPQQRTVFGELKDLADEISSAQLVSPTLIIIGKVVALSPFWPISAREESCLVEA